MVVHLHTSAMAADYAPSRRYGAYIPPAHDVDKFAATHAPSLYQPPTPYNLGYYDLPYRIRYGLYRPWYRTYFPPNYYRYYYRPWYAVPYTAVSPIPAAPAEPCYDGCYYW